jgi:hypothetical protein
VFGSKTGSVFVTIDWANSRITVAWPTRFFHFLSLAIERHQRIGIRRASFYVRIPRSKGGTPLENLPISSVSRTFGEHSPAVGFLRAVVVGHDSIPSEGSARALFSDMSPVYLNALFPPAFVAAPLDGKRFAPWRHVVHYDDAQAVSLAELNLHRSIPVYALFISTKEFDEKASRLPNVPGYRWVPAEDTTNAAVILRLTSTP